MAILNKCSKGHAKISLRKVKDKKAWALYLEVTGLNAEQNDGQSSSVESLSMTITTPVFDTSKPTRISKNGVKSYAPIRDSRGVIICTSIADQKKCNEAESLRKKKQKELDREVIYTTEENNLHYKLVNGDKDFIKFFEKAIPRMHANAADRTIGNWNRCLVYLKEFNHHLPLAFRNLDMQLCNEFRSYLLKRPAMRKGFEGQTITQAAAATYFSIFKAALKQAFIEDYLPINLGAQAKGITAPRAKRETLDMEELRLLGNTKCRNNWVKRAVLFTALTGLRHSDVKEIKWEQFKKTPTGWRLDFVQKKTGMPDYLPISEQAYSLCGEPGEPLDLVFKHLPEINNANKIIHEWVKNAGIERRITYHCFRHTFATLHLQRGTDLLTIKSMMGHTRVTTTEIYAHIVDSSKTKAAQAITIKNINLGKK